MRIHFESAEVDKLAADLTAAALKTARLASQAIAKTAHDIEADAKVFVPVDTGNLKNSISSDIDTFSAEIGPTANYGHYVEYGTSRMSPQPYMGPAFDQRTGPLERALAQIAENLL